jgi:glucosamine--fructose-6-phosphate aminotransferase (isomerizing)
MTTIPAPATGSLMEAEIAEQPARWLDFIESQKNSIEAAAALITSTSPQLVVFAARGSSDHAATYGQYLSQNLLGVPALLSTPSTVTAFDTHLAYPTSVMLAVSQSGESPDLLATVMSARSAGVPVIGFTNSPASALAGLSDVHIALSAGPELSVAATKTYTAELIALYAVLATASGQMYEALQTSVMTASVDAKRMIANIDRDIDTIAESLVDIEKLLIVGRGYSMSSAREGALKLMETNGIAASGWSAADATHGPLGQVAGDTPVIVLTASPGGRDSVLTFADAAALLGARIISLGPVDGRDNFLSVWDGAVATIDELLPALEIIPLQILALKLARRRGLDPDAPAGLNKVTLTH